MNEKFLEFYTTMCRTISKPVRLRILHLLGDRKMNVGEIQTEMEVSLPSLSNHLNDLYRAGILKKEKDGNFVYYYLAEPGLLRSIDGMMNSIKNILSTKPY